MDGKVQMITSLGGTVRDALDKADYIPRERDIVSHEFETPLEDGMEISVVRIDLLTETVSEVIPFAERQHENSTLKKGVELVTNEGADGERLYTYIRTLRDGVEISRNLASEEIIVPVQDRVIEIGTYVTPVPTPKPTATPRPTATPPTEALDAPALADLSYSRVLEVICYAYSTEGWKNKLNALGKVARVGTIAVDPKMIPLGTKGYVQAMDGSWVYGVAVAEDTGGMIKGNKIDLFYNTQDECRRFGIRKAYLYILD
jgi:3D (Asp-Asp-Asp) domain-containing protein